MSDRAVPLAVLLLLALGCAPARVSEPRSLAAATSPVTEVRAGHERPSPVTFEEDIRPILASRCQPCHFEGGKVYDLYPFDKPETVRTLGTKLFSRIKDESEQAVIQAFLDEADP